MAKLTEPVQTFIVQALACFDSPTEVAKAVREEFGVTIDRQQAQQYHPERRASKGMAEKWVKLFHATREQFLKEAGKVPIAQQAYRLRSLQRLHELAVSRNNAALAAQLLEQAAKEVGGAFTNRREVAGPNGGPIPVGHSGKVEHLHALQDSDLELLARGEPLPGPGSGGA
jgi:hypothetical protein